MILDNLPDDEWIPSKKELYKREMKEYEKQLENAETK